MCRWIFPLLFLVTSSFRFLSLYRVYDTNHKEKKRRTSPSFATDMSQPTEGHPEPTHEYTEISKLNTAAAPVPAQGVPVDGVPVQGVPVPGPSYGTTVPAAVNPLWSTRLCDCFNDWPSCCESYWCYCCVLGRQMGMLNTGVQKMDVGVCVLVCVFDTIGVYCTSVPWAKLVVSTMVRMKARTRFSLVSDEWTDCVLGFCCPNCSTCQVHREMSLRGQFCGGDFCVAQPYQIPHTVVMH